MAHSGCSWLIHYTARKTGARLLDHMDITELALFVDSAHAHGLMAGLSGSLETPDIPRLLPLAPDVLGFRRALCVDHDRIARNDPDAVAAVPALIPADTLKPHHSGEAPPKLPHHALSAPRNSITAHKKSPAP